jgi:serine/threonine-protein kinase
MTELLKPSHSVRETLSLQSVQHELEKIQASRTLSRSERLCRLLRFVVERAIAQPEENIEEYIIGTSVFDRPEAYDPRADPIVRVEARRLRTKLKEYYSAEGTSDLVVIELPKGRYRPIIRARFSGPARVDLRDAGEMATTIAVLPFASLTSGRDGAMFARGLTEELTHALTKCGGFRVLVWQSGFPLRRADETNASRRDHEKVDMALQGSVRRCRDALRVTAQLIAAADGALLWSHIYDTRASNRILVQLEIAGDISQGVSLAAARCAQMPDGEDVRASYPSSTAGVGSVGRSWRGALTR